MCNNTQNMFINLSIYPLMLKTSKDFIDLKSEFLVSLLFYIYLIVAPGTPHLIEDKFTRSLLVMKNDPAWLDCPFVNAHRIDWFSTHEKITNNTR